MDARGNVIALAGGSRRTGPVSGTEVGLQEIKAGLAAAGLDCGCRETVERILDGVARARSAHQRLEGLRDARQKRNGIAVLLKLLAEIEEITGAEPDLGVFEEAAALFEDIAALAMAGAEASRKAGALPRA
jgi:hypothetical protein